MRITINGDVYSTAGDAVRNQVGNLNNAISEIKDSIENGNGIATIAKDNSYEPLEL